MYLHIFYYCNNISILSCPADNNKNNKNPNILTPFMTSSTIKAISRYCVRAVAKKKLTPNLMVYWSTTPHLTPNSTRLLMLSSMMIKTITRSPKWAELTGFMGTMTLRVKLGGYLHRSLFGFFREKRTYSWWRQLASARLLLLEEDGRPFYTFSRHFTSLQ